MKRGKRVHAPGGDRHLEHKLIYPTEQYVRLCCELNLMEVVQCVVCVSGILGCGRKIS